MVKIKLAVAVPAKITKALRTRGPVPVHAQVNSSDPFLISLYSVGEGRHGIRIKASVRKEVCLKEGDRVKVEITVRDRTHEVSIPKDLARELRAVGLLENFKAISPGKRSFLLRKIEAAGKPETRSKRIGEALAATDAVRRKIRIFILGRSKY